MSFDKFSTLSGAKLRADIEEAYGSAIFNKWADTDETSMIVQVETATGHDINDSAALSDPARMISEISDAIGDSGSPDWVPANAKIYIDLIAPGRAWTEDDGEVAIDTLLGTDANTVNGWGTSSYDAGNLTVDGYVSDDVLGIIDGLRTKMLAGSTVVLRTKQLSDQTAGVEFALLAADGNDAIEILSAIAGLSGVSYDSYGGSLSEFIPNIRNLGADAMNVLAFTLTNNRMELAVNGSTALESVLASDDRPTGNPFVAGIILATSVAALQSITIYDALPSTAGLSALSETGITNTAPHDLAVYELAPTFAGPTVSASNDLDGGQAIFADFSVIDDQGNPLTWSFPVDDTGHFQFHAPVFGGQKAIMLDLTGTSLTPGNYSFTLRATDPGGLYVEQQFTITVTA